MTRPRIHVWKACKRQEGHNQHRYKKAAYGVENKNLEAFVIQLPIMMERLTDEKY